MPEVSSALDRVFHLHRLGEFANARTEGEAALTLHPDDPSLLRLLGDACCRTGDLAKGVDYLRKAHDLAPGEPGIRADLANALAAQGDLAAAEKVCEVGPGASAELSRVYGNILQAQGRHDEAIAAYGDVLAAHADDWETWNNLGNSLRAIGDRAMAADALSRAARLRPDVAAIHLNLGATLVEAGRLQDSVGAYQAAARLMPDHAPLLLDLGRLLRHLRRHSEALIPLRRAADLAPDHVQAQLELGRALASLALLDEAEDAYRRALAANPKSIAAYLELGILLERSNRVDSLVKLLSTADAQGVVGEELTYLRALSLRREGKLKEALALAVKAPAAIEPARRARLIGRLADALDDPETAFAAFEEMNRMALRSHPDARQRAEQYRRHVASVEALVDEDWYRSWWPAEPDQKRPAPVFLVGFPRSGTTLLDTILMGHPDIHVLEEEPILEPVKAALGGFSRLPGLDAAGVDRLRTLYFSELDKRLPVAAGAVIIDKLPLNLVGAPLIHRIFPDARFVFARRHPCDVVLSCFMQDFDINDAMANFLDLGDAALLYDGVLRLWEKCTEVLPLRVADVRYEGVVDDVEAEIRPLLEFLGVPWDDKVLDHERTAVERGRIMAPSYDQVTERIYDRASGRWERYRKQMAGVLPLLSPWAERMGYQV